MHRACVKIGFEMMIIHILYQAPDVFIFDKKCFEMMFGDIHEHNTKQSSLGHKISFFSSFFFLSWHALKWCFLTAEPLALTKRNTLNNKIWLSMHPRNFGSDKIVCTTYVPYVHILHVHPINVDNWERARARNKRKIWKFYSGVGKWEML